MRKIPWALIVTNILHSVCTPHLTILYTGKVEFVSKGYIVLTFQQNRFEKCSNASKAVEHRMRAHEKIVLKTRTIRTIMLEIQSKYNKSNGENLTRWVLARTLWKKVPLPATGIMDRTNDFPQNMSTHQIMATSAQQRNFAKCSPELRDQYSG